MDNYISLSQLNDFLFCPKSIYYHDLYKPYQDAMYKDKRQQQGTQAHESIDTKTYTTSKNILQSIPVYSDRYQLVGKIDLYDKDKKKLIERKRTIKQVFPGYIMQLYGQYFCLTEMGYEIQEITLHSLTDNQNYPVALPDEQAIKDFEKLLIDYRNFNPLDPTFSQNPLKCKNCIYRELCDFYLRNQS